MASITFMISEEEKKVLQNLAIEEDLSLSQVIRKIIKRYLASKSE